MPQKYNIAIIAGQLVVGGAERQLYLWLSQIDREKYQPVVLTLHSGYDDYWEGHIRQLDIPLLPIPQHLNRSARLLDIVNILRPYKPDLIHGWHLFSSPYAGAAAKLLGAKSLGGVRGSFQNFRSMPIESGLTMLLVNAIVANSRSTAKQLRKLLKYKKLGVYEVQNAVESQSTEHLAIREELSRYFGISSASIWIGSLGRLDPKKHFDMILQVLALLIKDVQDFHFILIGEGPERLRLEKLAESLGIAEVVTFAGEVPHASSWLSALDIFCFTSLDEGLPNVVMEAAVAGIPIVSWQAPFVEELLKGGSMVLLVEPENLGKFKDELLNLIRSPELRIKIGRAGREHVLENFTPYRFVQQMTHVYEALLGIQPTSVPEEL